MSSSQDLYIRAQRCIPAGVNSPVRAFRAVGGEPIFYQGGEGAYLIDSSGHRYLDYVCSWGAIILGHAHAPTLDALHNAISHGLGFGAPCELEVVLAEKITSLIPSMDAVRMLSSGTEATMTAIRLARGATGRNKIIKFEGCYHGHSDALLVKAGSGAATFGEPSSAGVPADFTQHTLVAEYNDLASVAKLFDEHGQDIAGIIVEPIAGNMNLIQPQADFLPGLRALCDHHGSVLIFDEVMSGFRVALGGAQSIYNVTPDLTTFGKVIGGGLPAAALGGRWEIMEHLAPLGAVYQAGTLSGNPIAMQAGLIALETISQAGFYERLNELSTQLTQGLQQLAQQAGIALQVAQCGGMLGLVFSDKPVLNFNDVANSDVERFRQFFHGMLQQGISLPPSAFEAWFISAAHKEQDITKTLQVAEQLFANLD